MEDRGPRSLAALSVEWRRVVYTCTYAGVSGARRGARGGRHLVANGTTVGQPPSPFPRLSSCAPGRWPLQRWCREAAAAIAGR
eukprot:scaffold2815_cov113-Isochrysis_galbana.AAC.9